MASTAVQGHPKSHGSVQVSGSYATAPGVAGGIRYFEANPASWVATQPFYCLSATHMQECTIGPCIIAVITPSASQVLLADPFTCLQVAAFQMLTGWPQEDLADPLGGTPLAGSALFDRLEEALGGPLRPVQVCVCTAAEQCSSRHIACSVGPAAWGWRR